MPEGFRQQLEAIRQLKTALETAHTKAVATDDPAADQLADQLERATRKEIAELKERLNPYERFTVQNAKNPYREALLEAGIPDSLLVAETKEIMVDIKQEIQHQLAVYASVLDASGNPILLEWITDITANQTRIHQEVARDHVKIEKRIKAGMIPVVMPGKRIQVATWKKAMTNLKPVWFKDSAEQSQNAPYLNPVYETDEVNGKKKMTEDGFFKDIPDHPYLVWTTPSQKPDPTTLNLDFATQQATLAQMRTTNPDLCGAIDITPTEYSALQAIFTHNIREQYKTLQPNQTIEPQTIKPLDYDTYTRFLSGGAFSGGYVPGGDFYPGSGDRRVRLGNGDPDADGESGFRPVARS